nr:retrotransposon-related protein [Tanacetum cinerariifolium]
MASMTPQRKSVPRLGEVLGTTNTTKPQSLPSPTGTSKPLAIKWISPVEWQERLPKRKMTYEPRPGMEEMMRSKVETSQSLIHLLVTGVCVLSNFGEKLVPTTLPPHRSIDHRIHLLPETKPVNVRPYRYLHYQKGEMEKLVNEMLSQEDVIQPLIPKTLHTTHPNEDYVAPATKPILDELLEEYRDEILNVTMVDEGSDFNLDKDIEELEKLLANDPKPHYMEIHGYNSEETKFEVTSTRNYVVDAHGVVLGSFFATRRHFKLGLVRYHAKDDDGVFV